MKKLFFTVLLLIIYITLINAIYAQSDEFKINCFETVKSGLCGPEDAIFPLSNNLEFSDYYIYQRGKIFEDSDIVIEANLPEFMFRLDKYTVDVNVTNKKGIPFNFIYNYIDCNDVPCNDFYNVFNVENFPGANKIIDAKGAMYYQINLNPSETRKMSLIVQPKIPTLVKTSVDFLRLYYYDESKPGYLLYTFNFQSWVKLRSNDPNYVYHKDDGKVVNNLLTCGDEIFAKIMGQSITHIEGLNAHTYTYSKSVCCNNIFYPGADCCSNSDCNEGSYCVDGICEPEYDQNNKLIGNKKLLIGMEYNEDDSCSVEAETSKEITSDIQKLEEYYDTMALKLMNKPSDFVNFEIDKVIKIPITLRGYHNLGDSEEKLFRYLSEKCDINPKDYDIIILPRDVSTRIETKGQALILGTGKIILYDLNNQPTLIHEIGHLFGCEDLYQNIGGKLQWAHTIYGDFRGVPYEYIYQDRISEIPLKTYQVCRGDLHWIDSDENGIFDIEETCNLDGTNSDGTCQEECGASPECNGLSSGIDCCSSCYYADINNDRTVNILDISLVARHFGLCDPDIAGECGGNPESRGSISYNPLYDFNSDGKINIIDISIVAKKFGKACTITIPIQTTEEMGFSYSNILLTFVVVVLVIIIIFSVFKIITRTQISTVSENQSSS